jgi:hypothetical protein
MCITILSYKNLCALHTEHICGVCMVVRMNNDFPMQNESLDICNRETVCFLEVGHAF